MDKLATCLKPQERANAKEGTKAGNVRNHGGYLKKTAEQSHLCLKRVTNICQL